MRQEEQEERFAAFQVEASFLLRRGGVRMVAYGNAEYSLSKDDLETARLRNRLSPWDIGLLRGSGEQPEAGQLMIHWQHATEPTRVPFFSRHFVWDRWR